MYYKNSTKKIEIKSNDFSKVQKVENFGEENTNKELDSLIIKQIITDVLVNVDSSFNNFLPNDSKNIIQKINKFRKMTKKHTRKMPHIVFPLTRSDAMKPFLTKTLY